MSYIVVCPLASIAETAVRHGAKEMVSLIAEKQDFHRPGVIRAERHLKLAMNDIGFAGTGGLIAPVRAQVEGVFATLKRWLGFACVRYVGLFKNLAHLHLLALAYNMRRALKLAG